MLIGEYRHILDPKKRISIPSKLRKELGKNVVVTHGLDNCLSIYSTKEWDKVSQKLRGLSMGQADTRGFNRFMLAGAALAEVDSIGRILIPDFLKAFGKLKDRVVLIGVNDHLEVWDEHAWDAYRERIEKQADRLAEKLGEIGAI